MTRVAFAGAGAVARRHMGLLAELDGVEVVAVCDRDERVAAPYRDVDAMLGDVALDALFVCTPPAAHAAPAIAALRRGVHVYVEKPLARSADDGAAIVDAWRSSGAVCAVGYQWRALDFLAELAATPRPGLLASRNVSAAEGGRIEQLRAAPPGEPPWFADQAVSGGILFELGSHDIDLQRAIAGPVAWAEAVAGPVALAQAGAAAGDVDDVLLLTLGFESGALGTIAVAWTGSDVPELFELDLLARSASYRIDLDPRFELVGQVDGKPVVRRARDPLRRSVARFVEAVRAGDPGLPFCTPADAYGTLAVALACERSLAGGGRVTATERPPR